MSERVVVSADDHLQEPPTLWQERLPAGLRDQAPRLVDLPDGGQGFAVADQAPRPLGILVMAGRSASEFTDKGLTWDDVPVGSYDPAGRLRDMETDGVSASVLYPNICLDMMMDQVRLSPELAREVYKVYNDHMSEFCSSAPDRLVGIGLLPMDTTDEAIEELERLGTLPGIRGALIPYIPPGGRDWNDPYFEPFWAAANEVGMPLSVHSGRPPLAAGARRDDGDARRWVDLHAHRPDRHGGDAGAHHVDGGLRPVSKPQARFRRRRDRVARLLHRARRARAEASQCVDGCAPEIGAARLVRAQPFRHVRGGRDGPARPRPDRRRVGDVGLGLPALGHDVAELDGDDRPGLRRRRRGDARDKITRGNAAKLYGLDF